MTTPPETPTSRSAWSWLGTVAVASVLLLAIGCLLGPEIYALINAIT